MIEVVDYDPAWSGCFTRLRDRYAVALAGVPLIAIEHVGSTSVEGLAAKPIIDIDIVVTRNHVAEAVAALQRIGYVPLGERGIADRWAFREPADIEPTNTYVVVEGSLALRNHLGVRDVLRCDDALRDEYASVKRNLARSTDDIDEYVDGKSAVLQKVLRQAGIGADDRAVIEDLNRH